MTDEHFDFDTIVPRRCTCSVKWDHCDCPDVLPAWVADMDFPAAPCIQRAIRQRAGHGIFGYTLVPPEYYQAVTSWFERRHHFHIEPEWIIYTTGVVPALSAIVRAVTRPGDKVLIQSPVYNCFYSSVRNNGCEVVSSDLVLSGDSYHIDFDDLEAKAALPEVTAMILCNPHNPAGRVWTRDELRRIGDICLRHNVFVIADEIHCELVFPPYRYTPFASLSHDFLMHSATCNSPSKAFNIAGLHIANITTADPDTRAKVDRAININEVCDVNPFGVAALIAAYNEGEPWLQALIAYLADNCRYVRDEMSRNLGELPIVRLEGTYLMWIDCHAIALNSREISQSLIDNEHVWLNEGMMYGEHTGEHFLRLNIACPRATLEAITARAIAGLRRLLKSHPAL